MKRKILWLLIGMVIIFLISTGPAIISCTTLENTSKAGAADLGLTPDEFEIIDTTIRDFLYETYPFLHDTEFGISYKRVDREVPGVPPGSPIIYAYADYRTPPVIIEAAFYEGNLEILSIE